MTQTTIPSALSQIAARLGAPAPAAAPATHAPSDVNPPEAKVEAPVTAVAPATIPAPPPQEAAKSKKEQKPKKETKVNAPAASAFVGGQTKCIGTLYINCVPSSAYASASEFIAQAKVDIRDVTKSESQPDGVPDYRFIDYKGAGYLAALVEEKVKAQGLVDKLVVDGETPEGRAVLSVLQALAHETVRGWR